MSGKILHPIQRACQHGNPQCARLKIRGSFILRPVYPPRSSRSLMATLSVNSTTKAITPKPIITAVNHDDEASREAKAAAVITALPTEVQKRGPVSMLTPEIQ